MFYRALQKRKEKKRNRLMRLMWPQSGFIYDIPCGHCSHRLTIHRLTYKTDVCFNKLQASKGHRYSRFQIQTIRQQNLAERSISADSLHVSEVLFLHRRNQRHLSAHSGASLPVPITQRHANGAVLIPFSLHKYVFRTKSWLLKSTIPNIWLKNTHDVDSLNAEWHLPA